jgi:hypothetical protein
LVSKRLLAAAVARRTRIRSSRPARTAPCAHTSIQGLCKGSECGAWGLGFRVLG